jgi:hypothetical protein
MQFDLFDQGSESQPGNRQTDLEMLIEEKAMNHYERKQEARRERLLAAAERAEAQSEAAYKRADLREEASGIPFGQPILVGHHSEGRHRAAIRRADNAMRASIEADKRAKELRGKAAGVGQGGISSDDPDAIQKLQAKIDADKGMQEFMKAANRAIRAAYKKGVRFDGPAEDIEIAQKALAKSCGREFSEAEARSMLQPDFANRIGFADYQLQNNNANIRRMEQRIAQLRAAQAAAEAAGGEEKRDVYQGLCEVVENFEENRLQIVFDGKPSAEVRAELKGNGFRWAPSQGAWQRQLNNGARYAAKRFLISQGIEA